jgi:hypothetical protein
MAHRGWPETRLYCACAFVARLLRLQSQTVNTYNLILLYARIITCTLLSVTLLYITCRFLVFSFLVSVVDLSAYYYVIFIGS